ncbi:UPF0135 protein ybgI [Candidatus Moranella endobia PCVAL]|nr:UPF0135 protein ybgI [Candidatus Moranella endobia PCVAL]
MRNTELEQLISKKLNNNSIVLKDYAPNGLQVEGRQDVNRIVTGVTACQALLDSAIAYSADAIIVHHGYFWQKESPVINGIKRWRLKTLLTNDINLYAWHLPLDTHPEIGNNAQLAAVLDITVTGNLDEPLIMQGEFNTKITGTELHRRLEQTLRGNVLHYGDGGPAYIKRLAWCTGGGQ